ncbi:MAG TPA: Trm112 family protein [Woeseiaceae bacterium]|jgi:uncharacterized protein YbaR (Trm112 family)
MDKRLLAILCCPISHKGLVRAGADLLRRINAAIADGRLANDGGVVLTEALREALVTDDGKRMYPIADGIPVLLADESVALDQLDDA